MSFVSGLKQLFRASPNAVAVVAPATIPDVAYSGSTPAKSQDLPWDATVGTVSQPHQERTLSYHNSELTGQCSGVIRALTGSTMVSAFEDLPHWLKSLAIRLRVEAQAGTLTVTVRRTDGTLFSVTAPGLVEEEVELVGGQFRFRCQADSQLVEGIQYQVSII